MPMTMREIFIDLNTPRVGWKGCFTTNEAQGAYPNGTRVVKSMVDSPDERPIGSLGTVLGSIPGLEEENVKFFYFIEWDILPRVAIGCMDCKVRKEEI